MRKLARRLLGTPAAYFTPDWQSHTVHTYGRLTDAQLRAFVTQTTGLNSDRFGIYRAA
jgi:hypothetical protein